MKNKKISLKESSGPGFYAYIPDKNGKEPMGTMGKHIFRNIKTIQGVVKKLNTVEAWRNAPYKVFTFSNLYDENSLKLVYENKPNVVNENKNEIIESKKINILVKKIERLSGKKVVMKEATSSNIQSLINTLNTSNQGLGDTGYKIEVSMSGGGTTIFLTNPAGEGGRNLFAGTTKEAIAFVNGMFAALRLKNGFLQ